MALTKQMERLTELLQGSYQARQKDTWKASTTIARVSNLWYPEVVCGARKAKYVSGTQFKNR